MKNTFVPISLCACLMLCSACTKDEASVPAAMAPEVKVMLVEQKDVPVFTEVVATIDGSVNAQIRAQVSGNILTQDYKEGGLVKTGDLLFTLDDRTYKAAFEQAKAEVAKAEALLGKAEQDEARYGPLVAKGAISRQEYETSVQAKHAAAAQVEAAKAALEQAKTNLDYTRIISPIDGIAGSAQANIGTLVGPGSGVLTTVSTVDPVKVYFMIGERDYIRAAAKVAEEEKKPMAERQDVFDLVLADGSVYAHKGKFFMADREIDVKTGSIKLAGQFPNPGNVLRPGQYAKVRAMSEKGKAAAVVPQRAVSELQGAYQAAVVGEDNVVSMRTLKLGQRSGTEWIVEEGLKPGERVVVEGLQKVKDGVKVTVKED